MKDVLIVEDEALLRESLRDWLTDLGYHVEVASQGDEGLKLIEEKDFDLVLLDLRLPGKDGLQVLREAKDRKPGLKGIIITANATIETAVRAMKLGAVDFLTKPLDLSLLENLIKEKTETAQSETKTLLIVDDEPSMRESLRDWFSALGYKVDISGDAEDALKLIRENDYGMLILDLRLPGKNGIELFMEAKKFRQDIQGIIITAYPSVDTAKKAIREGIIEYLPKPLALSELEELIAQNIGRPGVTILKQPLSKPAMAAILRILDRAAVDSRFLSLLAESPGVALAEYPELNGEQREALISGDIAKIESWVGTLNQQETAWLWCRLSQEKW